MSAFKWPKDHVEFLEFEATSCLRHTMETGVGFVLSMRMSVALAAVALLSSLLVILALVLLHGSDFQAGTVPLIDLTSNERR